MSHDKDRLCNHGDMLCIEVTNPAVPAGQKAAIIYLSPPGAALTQNTLKVALTNVSGAGISLSSGAQIDLDFTKLLFTPDDVKAIQLSIQASADWSALAAGKALALTYGGAGLLWANQAALEFTLTGVAVGLDPSQASDGALTVRATNIKGLANGAAGLWKNPVVTFLAAVTKDNTLALSMGFIQDPDVSRPGQDGVYISPAKGVGIDNALRFYLANEGAAIQGGRIEFSLECGNGSGDLIALDADGTPEVGRLHLDITNNYGSTTWGNIIAPVPSRGAERLTWSVGSQTATLMPAGNEAKVEFTFTHLVTTLASGVTFLHVTFKGMDNYNDAAYVLLIQKEEPPPAPEIVSFEGRIELVGGSPQAPGSPYLIVCWSTSHADHCTIEELKNGVLYDANPQTEIQIPLGEEEPLQTTYTLVAHPTEKDNSRTATRIVTARLIPAAITTLSLVPSAIDPGASAILSWAIKGATAVAIDNGVGAVALSGSVKVTPNPQRDTTYTITAQGLTGLITQPITLVVNSVKITDLDVGDVEFDHFTSVRCVSWKTLNATRAEIEYLKWDSKQGKQVRDTDVSGSVAVNDATQVAIDQYEYSKLTLTVWGPGPSPVSQSVDVPPVVGSPPV